MAYSSLSAFIKTLEEHNELIRVKEFVSPHLEIAEITDRFSKHKGKALLFENTGTQFPLLINAYGSESRICLALGVAKLDDIGKEMSDLIAGFMAPRESLMSKLSLLPTLASVAAWMPKRRGGKGICQEVVIHEPDLSVLPVLTCWPYDGGPFITLPIVHTKHPETGQRNVGMYRMQVMDASTTGMHWHLHKNSAAHFREYKRLGKRMPVAVALGGDPVYAYSATAPLPENVDEYLLAGFLRKRKVELVKCLTCDLEVPADADFILEGYVDPAEDMFIEGPFGDHTGFYSLADYYPRFHVTCITHRRDAVYPATLVGIPPQEDEWLGKATERIFLTPIRLSMLPEIIDMVMPVEGVFHNIVLVKIRKSFPGHAMKVMSSLWGAGQMMFNKVLVIVDEGVDLNDPEHVMQAIVAHTDPKKDIVLIPGPMDVLDHASTNFAFGSKMGIDATKKLPGEPSFQLSNEEIADTDKLRKNSIVGSVRADFLEKGIPLIFVFINKTERGQVRNLSSVMSEAGLLNGIRWVIFIDQVVADMDTGSIVWLVANNIDPIRDCFHVPGTRTFAIDGTMKTRQLDEFDRDWPNIVTMTDEVIEIVNKRWETLGLGDPLMSPSLRYKTLVKGSGAIAAK